MNQCSECGGVLKLGPPEGFMRLRGLYCEFCANREQPERTGLRFAVALGVALIFWNVFSCVAPLALRWP